ncbi:RagB/SusD family nutrient uptake outer membrane protein [Hufsiella ginkgonis]|uniref:RagB/SusD family nutrient uptake outer membrane protein n=1 Tax=Hufsiella ginkgonis TaxID=2695274 RepID=A0A7K1XSX9_9SPHI|nr:RagB/SusD family nutrient uptake outer membrane protein [Hufsiella ginkgonis]MXV14052.1 RagB/SusD family nutrient uptake outer membrane protein [Hufsiella ginkgonis]
MKGIKYFIAIMLFTGFTACKQDVLDIAPTTLLNKDQIFSSEAGVNAYFASMYYELPVLDFSYVNGQYGYNNFPAEGNTYTGNWTYEFLDGGPGYSGNNHNPNNGNSDFASWRKCYKAIRNVNSFLADVAVVSLAENKRIAYTAEARFLRAYNYMHLARIYGGVPILLENQVFDGGADTSPLNVPRNNESAVWDQVKADLDYAVSNLPETSVYGRANKYAALGILSRAMLFAGSVAKFGTVQINGLAGIEASKANSYLEASYAASKAIIDSKKYSLYNNYPTDKARNFQMLFIEVDKRGANPEAIFCKGWDYETTRYTHSQDCFALPEFIKGRSGYANRQQPSLDIVEMFEHVDGTPGTLNIGTAPTTASPTGAYVHYATVADLFKDFDPRFFGSILTSGQTFKNTLITAQRGVLDHTVTANFGRVQGNAKLQYYDAAQKKMVATGTPIVGTGNSRENSYSFWNKKYLDPDRPASLCGTWDSETDFIDIRYAEILLNFAEAADYLGKPGALESINLIRARAGIVPLASVDQARIRHERIVELAFENQLFFDMRRWRILTSEFNNRPRYGLDIYYDVQGKDYVFEKVTGSGNRTYNQDGRLNYEQIPLAERSKNPLLVNNPLY